MPKKPIRAVTFDLWDTLIIDDSDEPKRSSSGLPAKKEARRILVREALERHGPTDAEQVCVACDAADAAFNLFWMQQNVTITVRERLLIALGGLNRELPDSEVSALVTAHEEMELDVRPDLVSGVNEALGVLRKDFVLGVISDTVFSPGRTLRKLLEGFGIAFLFDSFVFSDEHGRSKPSAALFEQAARELKVELDEIVHVGDRENKDVDGAHGVGAKALLTTAVLDRGSELTRADGIVSDYSDLVSAVHALSGR